MLHAAQLRAARALLGWRQDDLSQASGVGLATIQRLEQGEGLVKANVATVVRLQEALGQAGLRLLPADDAGGIGVRLVKR
jgi:transcriptional regulator with XRE-family HTH domain